MEALFIKTLVSGQCYVKGCYVNKRTPIAHTHMKFKMIIMMTHNDLCMHYVINNDYLATCMCNLDPLILHLYLLFQQIIHVVEEEKRILTVSSLF